MTIRDEPRSNAAVAPAPNRRATDVKWGDTTMDLPRLDVRPGPVANSACTAGEGECQSGAFEGPLLLPSVGMHVWMEGRYVLDLDHGGWAELHPLYRWGRLP